jgi:hypothetical protein
MVYTRAIDDLIDAGTKLLESDFSEADFQEWRRKARMCLITMLGPDHSHVRNFAGGKLEDEEPSEETRAESKSRTA